ncbi:hypothetical protein DYB28_013302, partial [Aphanomyces astaci]
MLNELIRSLEQDHQEWVLHQEGKLVVEVMTKSIKPESLRTAVQMQLQLQRNKALKSNVFPYAEAIVPKTAEPPAKKGCLKCGAQRPRLAKPKPPEDVLFENIARVDDVLLDSGSDVTVVTRGVMDALDAAGVKVGTVSHSVPHLAYPYGSDAKPVVMTRSVKFNCVTLDTTCGPLVLRGLKAWVDDASTATELIVSRPVMELLGFSVEDLLVGA